MARKRKTRVGRYPKEFRRTAVDKLKNCDNIVALPEELRVHRRLLYKGRDQQISYCGLPADDVTCSFIAAAGISLPRGLIGARDFVESPLF